MALGSVLGAVAGSVASAGIGKLLGGDKAAGQAVGALQAAPIRRLRTSGLVFRNQGGKLRVDRTKATKGRLQRFSRIQNRAAGELAGLRGEVRPGFGRLTDARVQAVDNARRRSIGDLREQFARRRLAGSSFAADAQTRADLEFQQAEDRVRAESFLQELDLSVQLIEAETTRRSAAVLKNLEQANFEARVAADLGGVIQNAMTTAQTALSNLRAQEAAGIGRFGADIGGPIGDAVGGFFGGGGSAAPGELGFIDSPVFAGI